MNQSAFRAKLVAKAKKMKKPKPKFAFGKYNGKTLEYVAQVDPEYIVWVRDNVSRQYWPEGFLKVCREVQYSAEEDEMDAWAREAVDE